MEVLSVSTFWYGGRCTRYWRFLTVTEGPKTKTTPRGASKGIRCQIQVVIGEICTEMSRAEWTTWTGGPGIVICIPDSLMVGSGREREGVVWLPWCKECLPARRAYGR